MQQESTTNISYLGLERLPILVSGDPLTPLVARLCASHAQLYSNYAGRLAIIAERLRWRTRLRTNFGLNNDPAIIKHLELLRDKLRSLNKQRTALEIEQTRLIEQINFLGYTVNWADGHLEVS